MKKAYIYPLSSKAEKLGLYNPYVDDLVQSLGKYICFTNIDNPTNIGILDIFKYLGKIDYVFFNWIEVLPDKKGGKIQTLFLVFLLSLFKLFRIKIVWTMHNKLAHSLTNVYWKKLIFNKMLIYSDVIMTHSSEGIEYGEDMLKGAKYKIFYYPHPVKDRRLDKQDIKEYDILIWGTISPFKGIDKFLDYIYQNGLQNMYKILIIGKSRFEDYRKKLIKYKSNNILIKNEFIEDKLLQELIAKSKLVLFTYSQRSVLSSGVLMDSLGYGANIIGSDTGAFGDLAQEGIINTFTDFPEMFKKIDEQLDGKSEINNNKKLEDFLFNNSWDKYAINILKLLK